MAKRKYFKTQEQVKADIKRCQERRDSERKALEAKYRPQLEKLAMSTTIAELSTSQLASFRGEYDFEAFIDKLRRDGFSK